MGVVSLKLIVETIHSILPIPLALTKNYRKVRNADNTRNSFFLTGKSITSGCLITNELPWKHACK